MHHRTLMAGFLRGINVGGHHKVPMAALRTVVAASGFTNVRTLLNSGNLVFETDRTCIPDMQRLLEQDLSRHFGFDIPVMVRTMDALKDLVNSRPFESIDLQPDTRLYVTFLKDKPVQEFPVPYTSRDGSFQIISIRDTIICSILDVTITKTPKGMEVLEQIAGKGITTRNWNTIQKLIHI